MEDLEKEIEALLFISVLAVLNSLMAVTLVLKGGNRAKTHNNTFNVRQQAGWTAKSAASQQRGPLQRR